MLENVANDKTSDRTATTDFILSIENLREVELCAIDGHRYEEHSAKVIEKIDNWQDTLPFDVERNPKTGMREGSTGVTKIPGKHG